MSEVETIEEQETEAPDRGLLRREFAAELTAGNGRTVDVRIVPYGEQITHNDGMGDRPRGVAYREEWLPGVFSHQVNAANRVLANVEHEPGIAGVVGHGVMLREASDGFHGSFVLLPTAAGDTTLELVRAGSLDGISLEAQRKTDDTKSTPGVVKRVRANLRAIAFTRFGAYQGAKVLALREEAQTIDAAILPLELDPELIERLRAQGIALPDRYTAHPAETDTPAEAGTSEDGTRQTHVTTSSEES